MAAGSSVPGTKLEDMSRALEASRRVIAVAGSRYALDAQTAALDLVTLTDLNCLG